MRSVRLKADERGNVESALVLLPLLILFLTILQIAASALNRNEVNVSLNGDATRFNINSDLSAAALPVLDKGSDYPYSDSRQVINLPTGSQIVLTNRRVKFPTISPLLFNGDEFNDYGLSVR